MIEINQSDIIDFDGFEVIDAENGFPMCPSEIAEKEMPKDKRLLTIADGFCLSWEGFLFLTCETGEVFYVPKKGKYLIKVNEKFVRW